MEKVLLIKKNRAPKGLDKMLGKLNGLGGHCENDELPLNCIIREVKEESGLEINNWINFCNLDAKFGYVYCFYAVTDEIYNYIKMEDEDMNLYSCNYLIRDLFYQEYPRMHNLDYLIPMALNHAKKLDSCEIFEIKETYSENK